MLLEVMIAVLLVGLFASVSLGMLRRAVRGQSRMVQAVQKRRQIDLDRMRLIERCWGHMEELKKTPIQVKGASGITFEVSSQGGENNHLLIIKEAGSKKKPYYFLCSR